MKIAIAQLNPTIGNLTDNAQQILNVAQAAAEQGVRLLLTPELSLCGYPPRDLLLNPGFVEGMAQALEGLAQALPPSIAVLVGTVVENKRSPADGGKPLFNSIAWLEQGKVQQIFHKRLLPTYDVFDEYRYFESGIDSNFFTLNLEESSILVGVTICEDLWNDEEFWGKRSYAINPIAELAKLGVDIIVNLSASPYTVGKQKLREAMLKHGAIRYKQPIIYANQVGGNDDLIFDGNSVAFNRNGEIVCRASAFATDLVELEFDQEQQDLIAPSCNYPKSPTSEDEEIWNRFGISGCDRIRCNW
jgi:NAD+ synthase (glutamine-hydrolysing)